MSALGQYWTSPTLSFRGLANRFGDHPCPIAPFTGLIALLACLVYLLSGPMAVGADILAGARRAGFWIVFRSVMFWCLRRHCLPFLQFV